MKFSDELCEFFDAKLTPKYKSLLGEVSLRDFEAAIKTHFPEAIYFTFNDCERVNSFDIFIEDLVDRAYSQLESSRKDFTYFNVDCYAERPANLGATSDFVKYKLEDLWFEIVDALELTTDDNPGCNPTEKYMNDGAEFLRKAFAEIKDEADAVPLIGSVKVRVDKYELDLLTGRD